MVEAQRKIVYQEKNHHLLQGDEPATVKLGDEVHNLRPLWRRREPDSRKGYALAVDLMRQERDFANFLPLVCGLKMAGRRLRGDQFEKAARLMNQAGKQSIMLECCRRVRESGVDLSSPGFAQEVMHGAIHKGVSGEWSDKAKADALCYAESVWDLLWDQRHGAGRVVNPEIIALPLLMNAITGNNLAAMNYASDMLRLWHALPKPPQVEAFASEHAKLDESYRNMHAVIRWTPIYASLKQTSALLGTDSSLGQEIVAKMDEIRPQWEAWVQHMQTGHGAARGVFVLEALKQFL